MVDVVVGTGRMDENKTPAQLEERKHHIMLDSVHEVAHHAKRASTNHKLQHRIEVFTHMWATNDRVMTGGGTERSPGLVGCASHGDRSNARERSKTRSSRSVNHLTCDSVRR